MKNICLPTRIDLAGFGLAVLVAVSVSPHAQAQINEDFKLLPSDGDANDLFGQSVAISGATAIVGAAIDDDNGNASGSAYLFDVTTGQQIGKLLPMDGAQGGRFGRSVAISETTALIGATDDNGGSIGAAYLFDVTTGQQTWKLVPTDGKSGDDFGISVAISGVTAIVGAWGDDDNGSGSGSAYLFDVTTGQQIGKLVAADGDSGDSFGRSVAISGTTAIVGAHGDEDNGFQSGSAYLFDVTTGQQLAKLLATDGDAEDTFGFSVAISGTMAIVGAAEDDDNGFRSGSAYLFDATTGQQLAKLLAADGVENDYFGQSVAISGATAIVGAFADDDNGTQSGSAYLFDVANGKQSSKLLPTDGAPGDAFGRSVAISETAAIVGADGDDYNGPSSGSAYLFGNLGWLLSPISGNWYRALGPSTWQDAEDQATAWGGHLATVRSQAENDWLAATFEGGGSPFWIGYHDSLAEGTFVWASGETPGYENWQAGEPDDKNGADWAALVPSSARWIDETFLPERRSVVEVISDDCDADGLPDGYEIALDPSLDWNGDGVLDSCLTANYCDAALNSTGLPAVIGASGSPFTSENNFTLEAWDLPLDEFAYYLASESTAFIPGFGGSSGNLCLGPPIIRFNNPNFGGKVLNSGSTGTVTFTPDLNNLPQGITFDPGETWYFQLWYRDFTTLPTSNTTDGIEVMFR